MEVARDGARESGLPQENGYNNDLSTPRLGTLREANFATSSVVIIGRHSVIVGKASAETFRATAP